MLLGGVRVKCDSVCDHGECEQRKEIFGCCFFCVTLVLLPCRSRIQKLFTPHKKDDTVAALCEQILENGGVVSSVDEDVVDDSYLVSLYFFLFAAFLCCREILSFCGGLIEVTRTKQSNPVIHRWRRSFIVTPPTQNYP